MIKPLVVAVLPIFNPQDDIIERIQQLKAQTDLVVVVDDGSKNDPRRDQRIASIQSVILLHQSNSGIAAALNSGIRCALERLPSTKFVVTMDQDSFLSPNYVEQAIGVFALAALEKVPVGIVAAERFNDWAVTAEGSVGSFRDVIDVAQSGMVIHTDCIKNSGFFEESFFIDCVDTEYVLRLRSAGVLTVLGANCWLEHEAGILITPTIWGHEIRARGRVLKFSYHTAIRRYYITRNRLLIYAQYAHVHPRWASREIVKETRTLILSVIFGPAKFRQLLAVLLGARGALTGRRGRVAVDVSARLNV